MNLLKLEAQFSKQLKNTQIKSTTKDITQFIPFVKERDNMGRLIKSRQQKKKRSSIASASNSPDLDIKSKDMNQNQLDEKLLHFFKRNILFASCQLEKSKITKKTFIQVLTEGPKVSKKLNNSPKKNDLIRPSTTYTHIAKFTKTVLGHEDEIPKTAPAIQRSRSTILPRRNSEHSRQKQGKNQENERRTSYFEPEVNIESNLNKYPQLKRIRRMKQLEVKLHEDFQENHGRFLNKMIKSKQLAFELKVNLDHIDGYF